MIIPDCFKSLKQEQIKAFLEWYKQVTTPAEREAALEEDCTMAGPTFHVMATGMGDVIYCKVKDRTFHLSIDDEEQIIGEVK